MKYHLMKSTVSGLNSFLFISAGATQKDSFRIGIFRQLFDFIEGYGLALCKAFHADQLVHINLDLFSTIRTSVSLVTPT